MPLVRHGAERLGEHCQGVHAQGRFPCFGDERLAFHPHEIAQVEQLENLVSLGPDFFGVDENLDAPRRIGQIEKVALAHVPVRGDPAGHPFAIPLCKAGADFFDGTRQIKALPKRRDSLFAQGEHLLAADFKQGMSLFHIGKPPLNQPKRAKSMRALWLRRSSNEQK